MSKPKISIYTLRKLITDWNTTNIRVWEENEIVYEGAIGDCPEELLHRPIPEIVPHDCCIAICF